MFYTGRVCRLRANAPATDPSLGGEPDAQADYGDPDRPRCGLDISGRTGRRPEGGSEVFGSEVFGSEVFGSEVFGSEVFGSEVFGSEVFGAPYMDMTNVMFKSQLFKDQLDSVSGGGRAGSHRRAARTRPAGRGVIAGAPSTTGPRAVLTCQASPAVSARVVRQYAAWVAKITGPDKAQQLQAEFTRHSPVALWAGAERSDGLKPGNVADVLTSYWVMNRMIANGVPSTTAAQVQRQEMAETLMLNYVMQSLAYGAAVRKGDKDLARRLGDAAVTRFKNEAHVDLRRVRLTDDGFQGARGPAVETAGPLQFRDAP